MALVTGHEHQRFTSGELLPLVLGDCKVERAEGPQRVAEQQEPGMANARSMPNVNTPIAPSGANGPSQKFFRR